MEPVTFSLVLWTVVVALIDKGVETGWSPMDGAIKEGWAKLTKQDKDSNRKRAFVTAYEQAVEKVKDHSEAPQLVDEIVKSLDDVDDETRKLIAVEFSKILLFGENPDIHKLVSVSAKRIHNAPEWIKKIRSIRDDFTLLHTSEEDISRVIHRLISELKSALLNQEIFQVLWKNEVLEYIIRLVEIHTPDIDSEEVYKKQLVASLNYMGFYGFPDLRDHEDIELLDIYVPLKFQPVPKPKPKDEEVLPKELELLNQNNNQATRSATEAQITDSSEPLSITQLFSTKRIILLGQGGAGKTTTLQYIIVEAMGNAIPNLTNKHDLLPIYIPLSEFVAEYKKTNAEYSLINYMSTRAHENYTVRIPTSFFWDALEEGRCLVCLDAYDEVWALKDRKRVKEGINSLLSRFPDNYYILTSRSDSYNEFPLHHNFAQYNILAMNNGNIDEFVKKWYTLREKTNPKRRDEAIKNLITSIHAHPRIEELARVPLLLTIIALIHRVDRELPHERVMLYEKCIEAIVHSWEEFKEIAIEDRVRPYYSRRKSLLQRLAYDLHIRGETGGQVGIISTYDLENLITDYLLEDTTQQLPNRSVATAEAKEFIRLIKLRTGLIIQKGDNFSFSHLTFQEYLAAYYLEVEIHYPDSIWSEIETRLLDAHWKNVIILLLGILSHVHIVPRKINDLINKILQKSSQDKLEKHIHRYHILIGQALSEHIQIDYKLKQEIIKYFLDIVKNAYITDIFINLKGVTSLGLVSDVIRILDTVPILDNLSTALLAILPEAKSQSVKQAIYWCIGRYACAAENNLLTVLTNNLQTNVIPVGAIYGISRIDCDDKKQEVLSSLRDLMSSTTNIDTMLHLSRTFMKLGAKSDAIQGVKQAINHLGKKPTYHRLSIFRLIKEFGIEDIQLPPLEKTQVKLDSNDELQKILMLSNSSIEEKKRKNYYSLIEEYIIASDEPSILLMVLLELSEHDTELIQVWGRLLDNNKNRLTVTTVYYLAAAIGEHDITKAVSILESISSEPNNLIIRSQSLLIQYYINRQDNTLDDFLDILNDISDEYPSLYQKLCAQLYKVDLSLYERKFSIASDWTDVSVEGETIADNFIEEGNILKDEMHYELAVAKYEEAGKFKDISIDLLFGLWLSYAGEYDRALYIYNNALTKNPQNLEPALYNIAVVLSRMNDAITLEVNSAIVTARKVLLENKNQMSDARQFYGLAGLAALEGRSDNAFQLIERCLSLANSYKAEYLTWLKHDIAWLELRIDERFAVLFD